MTVQNESITKLSSIGQSIWLDNLSRRILEDGSFAALVAKGVRGLTSNPSIFKKSIADSSDYDKDIAILGKKGLSSDEIAIELMTGDVGGAADALLGVYNESGFADGFASIEVSPLLAHDTEGTVKEGQRLWDLLSRPNVMIKVPATREGLPAIEELLSRGINVNVTLIFSVARYEEVVKAYIRGLTRRSAQGKPVSSISSVASFFVSRLDSIIERELEGKVSSLQGRFFGKVGIANCRDAYDKFQKLFSSPEFLDLEKQGAKQQRPLWASTGTKNSSFSPLLYIDNLVAPNTVNTVPTATLDALLQGISPAPLLQLPLDNALTTIRGLGEVDISLDKLLLELEKDGVKQFSEAYAALLDAIEVKRSKVI